MSQYKRHELSTAFADMSGEEYKVLLDSINHIGLQNPITLFEGQVLDGWHRYKACLERQVPASFVELADVDAGEFVLAQNKARRSSTQAQLALAVNAVYTWQRGRPQNNCDGTADLSQAEIKAVVATELNQNQVAKKHGLSTSSLRKAGQIEESPLAVAAVKAGKMGLDKAVAISKLPIAEQAAAINKPLPRPVPEVAPVILVIDEEGAPDETEMQLVRIQEEAAAKTMQFMLESDEPLAQLAAKNTQLESQIKQLNLRIAGLMNSNTEYIRTIKRLQAQIKKVQL